jgi:hypothetical protein
MKKIIAPYRSENGLPLTMRYMRDGIGSCEIRLADDWRVAPADGLKQSLADGLGVKGGGGRILTKRISHWKNGGAFPIAGTFRAASPLIRRF